MTTLRARSELDSKGFNSGVDGMQNKVKGFGSQLLGMKSLIAGAFTIGFLSAARGISRARMEMEDLNSQLTILFRDGEKARRVLEELKRFSAVTPFQIGDIAESTRLLFTFSDGAIQGTDILQRLGDAAAATGQKEMKNLAMWVGRAYSAIQSGRPFGEAAQRLQEMGVLSGEARNRLEDMTKAGADTDEIWTELLSTMDKFSGGMKLMSETASGKMSTLRDNFKLALADMGAAFDPVTKAMIEFGTASSQVLASFVKGWRFVFSTFKQLSFGDSFAQATKVAREEFFGKEDEIILKTRAELAAGRAKKADAAFEAAFAATRAREKSKERKEEVKHNKRLAAIEQKTFDKKSALQKKDFGIGFAVDRITRIGGQLGGQAAPGARMAQRQLAVLQAIKTIDERMASDIGKETARHIKANSGLQPD